MLLLEAVSLEQSCFIVFTEEKETVNDTLHPCETFPTNHSLIALQFNCDGCVTTQLMYIINSN